MNFTVKKLLIALYSISVINLGFAAESAISGLSNTNISNNAINKSAANNNLETQTSNQPTNDNKVVLNFENADIQTVIKAISKLSGKNFVIDPRVKGTINIVSEKPITKAESYKVLESALRMQGFATVEADGVIKVLPETDAKTYGMRTFGEKIKSNPGDQLVTKVFVIEKGSATQLSNALRPLIASNNSITVYPNSNALIVTDYASNMSRISKIINSLSSTNGLNAAGAPLIVQLKNSVAADIAQTLQSYMQGGGNVGNGNNSGASGSDGPTAAITVDSATNSIIISSIIAGKAIELKNLALKLDAQNKITNNNLHVVYLKNADAAHVAEVLRVITSGQDNPDMMASSNGRSLSDTSSMFSGSSGSSGSGSNSMSSSSNSLTRNISTNRPGQTSANSDKNAPKTLIQAEPTTNSLIIQAPEAIYRNLRMVIDMLDVRRVQIMIEVMIADISSTTNGEFGIQWVTGAGNNNVGAAVVGNYGGTGVGGVNTSIGSIATSIIGATGAANGLAGTSGGIPQFPNQVLIGLVTGTTTVGGQVIPTISTLANMITSNSAGNVLARPTLLTLDNEEASIMVGQNIGIPTGSYQQTNTGTSNPFTTVNRQDIGTQLKIKPLVTQSGAIQLSVYQEDSKLDPNQNQATITTNGPNIIKRNLKTQIMVDDGQIIALGGMTQDVLALQNQGIPVLSDIPLIGFLFQWQSRSHNKSNMVIFLRPVIIRNIEGYKALTNQRYNYVMGQENQVKASGNILLPNIKPLTLDNQLPYTNSLPAQPTTTNSTAPIVDLRQSSDTKNSLNENLNQANTLSSSDIKVSQPAPNSISITNN